MYGFMYFKNFAIIIIQKLGNQAETNIKTKLMVILKIDKQYKSYQHMNIFSRKLRRIKMIEYRCDIPLNVANV